MSPADVARIAERCGFGLGMVAHLHPSEQRALEKAFPDEVHDYFSHLLSCRECLKRATRQVTCAGCLHFTRNPNNPEAGMGTCASIENSHWPEPTKVAPLYPDIPRACPSWRPAAEIARSRS